MTRGTCSSILLSSSSNMERSKRAENDVDLDSIEKKKMKLNIRFSSSLEDLANETIYEIFDYLEITHVYDAFFDLNQRFEHLLVHSNLPIQVNLSTMSKTSFQRYHQNIIIPNQHRINYLRLSNPFSVEIVFAQRYLMTKFIQLETFILEHIHARYLQHLLKHAIRLPKLRTLVLSLADLVQTPAILFAAILRLPNLKSCTITYSIKDRKHPFYLFNGRFRISRIERLVINAYLRFDSLEDLLPYLPNLRHLSIKTLIGDYQCSSSRCNSRLKHVSLELEGVPWHRLERIMRNSFHHVQSLRLTIKSDPTSFVADRWEQFIPSYLPNLRTFDMNYNVAPDDAVTFHRLVERFKSPFWIERGWFFAHQHAWSYILQNGVLYSTDPYRRRDYQLSWPSVDQICPYLFENNLDSVRHVSISGRPTAINPVNYFPNATELTMENDCHTSDHSIAITLQHIVPLEQLTKLSFQRYDCSINEIIDLLRCTPNLHTLKFYLPWMNEHTRNSIRQDETFRYVSKTNTIKHVQLCSWSGLESVQFLIRLFPQMEYLETGMDRKQIEPIIRYLLATRNSPRCRLCFLRLLKAPKSCLHEIDQLIRSEQLIDDYSIKHLNRDLYFWW